MHSNQRECAHCEATPRGDKIWECPKCTNFLCIECFNPYCLNCARGRPQLHEEELVCNSCATAELNETAQHTHIIKYLSSFKWHGLVRDTMICVLCGKLSYTKFRKQEEGDANANTAR